MDDDTPLLRPRVFVSTKEACALLGVDRDTLQGLMDARRLTWWQIGGFRKLNLYDIRRYNRSLPPVPSARKRRDPISTRTRFLVLERDNFRCRYCGASADDEALVLDHVVSVADGGSSDMDNLVAACQPCNAGKGRRSLTIVA